MQSLIYSKPVSETLFTSSSYLYIVRYPDSTGTSLLETSSLFALTAECRHAYCACADISCLDFVTSSSKQLDFSTNSTRFASTIEIAESGRWTSAHFS